MNRDEVVAVLKSWGVSKPFKVYRSEEGTRWNVLVKKPAEWVDGYFSGSDILIDFDRKCFRVWTASRQRARALASEHGLRVDLLDGEAELWVPGSLADELLPRFGARIKRENSPGQKAALASGRWNSPVYKKTHGE
jgi:hypothetical protein